MVNTNLDTEVADLWLRGNAGEKLSTEDAYRFELLTQARYFYFHFAYHGFLDADVSPELADNTVRNLIGEVKRFPEMRNALKNSFDWPIMRRARELDPEWAAALEDELASD